MGCENDRDNYQKIGSGDAVYAVEFEGHRYVIYDGQRQGDIVHAESCQCKDGKAHREP